MMGSRHAQVGTGSDVASAPEVIVLPTPYGIGPVNTYLVRSDPLTLVDCGPATTHALEALELGLAAHGHRIEDLERVVVTHHHGDHFGLAASIARRSGAEVCAFAGIAGWLEDYDARTRDEMRFIEQKLVRHGLPEEVAMGCRATDALMAAFGSPVHVDRPLRDGDRLEFSDRVWLAHHRPGHSTSDMVFHDPDRRELLGGDHLLAHVSSNALIAEPLLESDQRADPTGRLTPLRTYFGSLAQTRAMDLDRVLPGHGSPLTGHRELIDQRIVDRDRRLDRIADEVAAGRTTAFAVGRAIWGRTALVQVHLVMSEVLGHLEQLEVEGRIRVIETPDGRVELAPV